MKFNLFFRITQPKVAGSVFRSKFSLLLLFILVGIPSVISASVLENDNLDQGSEGVIYVSGNAVLFGENSISNGKIIEIESTKENVSREPTKKLEVIADLVKVHQKSKEIALQKILDNAKKDKKKICFESSWNPKFFNLTLSKMAGFSSQISNSYSKLSALLHFWVKVLPNYKIQLEKQKYYTSLSYLQFGKYTNSSRRGPPQLS